VTIAIPTAISTKAALIHGKAGADWAQRLPELVAYCARLWSLEVEAPFADASLSYAAPARRPNGEKVALKLCFPNHEFFTELEALQAFDGQMAVKLLEADKTRGALLLERLEPGDSLSTMEDDVTATSVAARVMSGLWRPAASVRGSFPSVQDWLEGMTERSSKALEMNSSFPAHLLDYASGLGSDLMWDATDSILLHGDLHHGNILAAAREPWLAIDPKGVTGEPACEIDPFLRENLPAQDWQPVMWRRLDQLSDELSLDREHLRAWCFVRAVLSAFWSLEDEGRGWEQAIAVAEALTAGPG